MESALQLEYIPSHQRGVTDADWLLSRHTFSFGRYYNLDRLNFGMLRVFNDDIVKPGKGFGSHSHDNMEIVTLVLDGALKHKDSMGNEGIIKAGEVQRMSAGKGIEHSEMNASETDPVHFLQIWVFPSKRDLDPTYEQKEFSPEQLKNALFPIVSAPPSEQSLTIHQDATVFLSHLDRGMQLTHTIRNKRHGAFLYLIEGEAVVGGQTMSSGDTVQIAQQGQIDIAATSDAKLLLIEVSVQSL
jgi:hypothetical protein